MRAPALMIPSVALLALACAGPTASLPAEPVWSAAVQSPPRGNAGLVLEIRNEAPALGALLGVAAVLDGTLVFREVPWHGEQQPRAPVIWTTGGRHQLCVVAHYQGPDEAAGTFVVRAPRLLDLIPGTTVSTRLLLQQQLNPHPYATASYQGGLPYASRSQQPDPEQYERRLDELCGNGG